MPCEPQKRVTSYGVWRLEACPLDAELVYHRHGVWSASQRVMTSRTCLCARTPWHYKRGCDNQLAQVASVDSCPVSGATHGPLCGLCCRFLRCYGYRRVFIHDHLGTLGGPAGGGQARPLRLRRKIHCFETGRRKRSLRVCTITSRAVRQSTTGGRRTRKMAGAICGGRPWRRRRRN